jgi:D-alanyl-D-alanine carboxypeptidase
MVMACFRKRVAKDRNRIVHFHRPSLFKAASRSLVLVAAFTLITTQFANAEALLLVEADSGKVLQAENATYPWYPASLTKLMTAYVTMKAVKEGRITLDTLFTVSPTAASQSPSKMGFKPGTQVTVDNALKMLLVKSANDMAVVLAEGVGGSIDGFAEMMNDNARRLGMTQTNYVNPNGLPADGHVTSARDLAMLARAIIHDFPEYEYFVHIPSIRYGRRITQNFNKLIGRYPGADGFKTGFICASGYNLVASATRNGQRLIAVVLGASSGQARAVKAIQLLDRGFANDQLSWLRPSLGTVDSLAPVDASPPDLRDEMCNGKHHHPASDEDDTTASNGSDGSGQALAFFSTGQTQTLKPSEILAAAPAPSEPIAVYTGPTRTGAALIAAVTADADEQAAAAHHGKKAHHGAKKPPEAGADEAVKEAKPKPVKHANAKPDAAAKTADKPAAADAKPAKPKAVAKPAKPAPKSDKDSDG